MTQRQLLFDRPVPPGWSVVKVDQVKADEPASCSAGPFGSNISSKYFVASGVPVIRGSNLRTDLTRFVPEGFVFVTEEQAKRYKGQHVRAGDLVFTCWGTLGQVGLIPDRGPFPEYIISNKQLKLRVKRKIASPLYLFYYFACPEMVKHIQSIAIGAAVPGINLGLLKNIDIVLPPRRTQDKITSVLSAYDDLIENNARRIAVLESLAQAVYREWLVEFRLPESLGGDVPSASPRRPPSDWKIKAIRSVLDFHIGGGWGKDAPEDGYSQAAYVIRGTDIPDARTLRVVNCPLRYHSGSNLRSRKLKANDLVFEVSGGSKEQPVGRCLFVSDRLLGRFAGDVMCASFCKLVRANPNELAPELLYHYLRECYTNGIIEQYEVQSTGIKNFKFTVFIEDETIATPTKRVQEAFVSHVRPLMDEAHLLGHKVQNLRRTRDLLLPKLISGELDLESLDIQVEEEMVAAET